MAPQRRGACWQCYPANRDGCRRPLRHRYPCIAVLNRSNSAAPRCWQARPVGLHVGARAGAAGAGTRRLVPGGWRGRARGRSAVLVDGVGRSATERAGRGSVAAQPGPGTIRAPAAGRARGRWSLALALPAGFRGRRPPGAGRPGQGFLFPRQHRHGLGAGPVRRGREQQAAGRRGRRPGRRSRAGPARVGGRGRGAQLSGPGRGQRSDRAADADGRAGPRGRAAGAGAAEHPPGHAAGRRHGQRAPAAHPGRAGVDAPGGRPVGARAGAAAGRDAPDPGWSAVAPSQGLPGFALGKCRPTCCAPVRTSARPKPKCFGPPQGWAWRARRCIRA